MDFLKRNRRFMEFTLGFVSFGLGQRLIGSGFLQPWIKEKQRLLVLGWLGIILLLVGLFFLGKVTIWIFKNYNQNHRVTKLFLGMVALTIIGGLMIGGVGQFVYDKKWFDYATVKKAIWLISSVFQIIIKVMMVNVLSCYYRGSNFSWRSKNLYKQMLIVIISALMVSAIGLMVPVAAEVLLYMLDVTVVLGTIYCKIKK